jgi:hypothetical protein
VVTAEPFYTANNRDLRAALQHSTDRTLFASLRSLERLVLYPGDVLGPALLQISSDDDLSNWMLTSSLTHVLGAAPVDETPMLAAARAAVFPQDTDDAVTG